LVFQAELLARRPKNRVRVERRSAPPFLVLSDLCDAEVQMWSVGRRVACGPHVSDDVAPPHVRSLGEMRFIGIEMRVVVAIALGWIELIDRAPAWNAKK